MTRLRIVPPPPALGVIDTSRDGADLAVSVAKHVQRVVMHRTLSPAQQVQVLLLVAANIASDVPDSQLPAALDFFCTDAALRWHHATHDRATLVGMPAMGSA